MASVKRFLAAITGSKKAMATVVAIVFALFVKPIADRTGVAVSQEDVYFVVGLLVTYVLGQGIADSGKEAAKIVAASPVAPQVNNTAGVMVVSPPEPAPAQPEVVL